jgi:hypothetical protein
LSCRGVHNHLRDCRCWYNMRTTYRNPNTNPDDWQDLQPMRAFALLAFRFAALSRGVSYETISILAFTHRLFRLSISQDAWIKSWRLQRQNHLLPLQLLLADVSSDEFRMRNARGRRTRQSSLHGRVPFDSLNADMEIHADVLPARRGKASAYVPSSAAANAVV